MIGFRKVEEYGASAGSGRRSFYENDDQKDDRAGGYEVAGEAGNGVEAVQRYMDIQPDVVLLDITMPEMNGIDALKRIKEFDPKAKVIMCSAMGQQVMVAQAIQSGAKDFVVKPFEKDRVLAAIKRVLG